MPDALVVAVPIALEMIGLAYLRTAYVKIVEDKSTMLLSASVFFNALQASLVALPMFVAFAVGVSHDLIWT